jgi:HAD superfamily hydrolase (TIGR01490 family)
MSLALFDLDHTLLRGDSDHAWGEYLAGQGAVDPGLFRAENERYYAAYVAGTLDIFEFLEQHQLKPLARYDRATLDRWHEGFMREKIAPLITASARELVEHHRARGDTLIVITSTNRFITAPIARAFDIPHLIATEPEERDGRFTGKVSGIPSYREGKVTRLREWMRANNRSLDDSWFYSDSHNDLPLLRLVTHPVAVNPDPELARHAASHGWKVLHLA